MCFVNILLKFWHKILDLRLQTFYVYGKAMTGKKLLHFYLSTFDSVT